jgi:hypothetical protein
MTLAKSLPKYRQNPHFWKNMYKKLIKKSPPFPFESGGDF